jgi:hypothetical protein
LAAEYRLHYAKDSDVVTFSKYHETNRTNFGLNELLYDVCVCGTSSVASCRGTSSLQYVSKVLWQVESEFARDSKQALFDFNKLVLGSAKCKLFIGPIVHDCDAFMQTLSAPAQYCTGEVYAALLPEPAKWKSPIQPRFFQFVSGKWRPSPG